MTGDGEDDGQQHPQGGGAKAGPQDRPPGPERRCRRAEWRHDTAAVAQQSRSDEGFTQQE